VPIVDAYTVTAVRRLSVKIRRSGPVSAVKRASLVLNAPFRLNCIISTLCLLEALELSAARRSSACYRIVMLISA
jgi:hypothetical protein